MLASRAARIRQLSGEVHLEEAPLPRINFQPRFRVEGISQHEKDLAESFLKKEASAARESKPLLRRVKSRLSRPDKAVTATALRHYVEANGSAEIAQIFIDKLTLESLRTAQPLELPDNLLLTSVKHSNTDLARLLAPFTAPEAINTALKDAILVQDRRTVRALLEYGADPNGLSLASLIKLAETNLPLFQTLLQSPKQICSTTFADLCTAALSNGNSDALNLLLRVIVNYQLFREPTTPWNRDSLLSLAIRFPNKGFFFAIASYTSTWPLHDHGLFLSVLDAAGVDRCLTKDMVEVLLCLIGKPQSFKGGLELESTFCRCIEQDHEDIIRLLISYGVYVSPRPLLLACENRDTRLLDVLLKGQIQGGEHVLSRIAGLSGKTEEMRQKVIMGMLESGKRGVWLHDELVNAVSLRQLHLVEALMKANASVDYHNGAALQKAILSGQVSMVTILLSRPTSMETLQAAFPIVRQLENLPRRLLTKLFVHAGISGQCLDDVLNEELCNYSHDRDPELVDILIAAGGRCNDVSMTVALEHNDATIFNKVQASKTMLDGSVSEWFKGCHQSLFSRVQQGGLGAEVASACLKLLFRKLDFIGDLCQNHHESQPYACFNKYLESGADDIGLFLSGLKWGEKMDRVAFTELVLTAACFCDPGKLHRITRSRPFPPGQQIFPPTGTGNPISAFQRTKSNQFSSSRIPPLNHHNFSDTRSAETLKILFRQYFQEGPESHLVTKLLKRHLEECTQSISQGETWPLLTIQFLLSQPIEVSLSEYVSCLYMAIAFQQWTVLGMLLDRSLSKDMVSCFFLVDTSSLAPRAIEILLESKAMTGMDDRFFTDVVQRTFNYACLAQDQEMALLLCSRSRCKLHIRDVLVSLQQAIDSSELHYVSSVLRETSFAQTDLETLWQHINRQYLATDYLPTLEILLKAGADGNSVIATLMDAIELSDESLISLILAYWKAPRLRQYHEEFDYQTRRPIPRAPEKVPIGAYYPVLARALGAAISSDKASICWLLCSADAPLVVEGKSLIELAVVLGSRAALISLIRFAKTRPEMQEAVNFALLLTVVHNRPTWVDGLIRLGGTLDSYNYEPLKASTQHNHLEVQTSVLLCNPTLPGLHVMFRAIRDRFAESGVDLGLLCAMFERLHKAGFHDQESFNEALVTLCRDKSALWDQVSILIDCGASVEYKDGECLMELWKHGNLQMFPRLFCCCSQQSIATNLFNMACSDYLQQGHTSIFTSVDGAFVVLAALLGTDIPQESLDEALDGIAGVCHKKPDSAPIIQLLLKKGARFFEGSGAALYRVCRLDDPKITVLINNSHPHVRTRLLALHHLFRDQGTAISNGSTHHPQAFDPSDHSCLYNINFPELAIEDLDLKASDIINLLGGMLNPKSTFVGTGLMFSFFFMRGGLNLLSSQFCSEDNRTELEQILRSSIENSSSKELDQRIEFLVRVMQIDAPVSTGLVSDYSGFALKKGALNRLLLPATSRQRIDLVRTLLEAGADPSTTDQSGYSGLYNATFDCNIPIMEMLIDKGARTDDGSLHIATCLQYHEAMQLLLESGHDPKHRSPLFHDATPLGAFLRFDHLKESQELVEMTLAILLCDSEIPKEFWTEDPNPLHLALTGTWPHQIFSALLCYMPSKVAELPLLRRDKFMYSVLSMVERWDHLALDDIERVDLSVRLEALEFTRTYYALEGDQPDDAIDVPEHLEAPEIRARRKAWRTKDCAVCGDKPANPKDIHGALSADCEDNHGWDDDIICTDCLQGYLESHMFPQGDDRFPSAKVKCWAPNCAETLSHAVLQEFSPPARFAVYDLSLAQLCLNDGENTAKCAFDDCTGATWLGDEDKDVTIFKCPVCRRDTCIQCNQPYEKHVDEPCPAGEEAQGIERRREEEKATAAAMAQGKKCPKCSLPYERIEGCDHIVCGKDAHSAARSRGCGFEFCYLCGADYNQIRKQGNTAHDRSCNYYA